MAIVLYKNADRTVDTIADRNAITAKIDHMVVVVLDAIADPAASSGIATYRWNETLDAWILVSKSGTESISFATEELLISGGGVTLTNVPTDNQIWDLKVVDGSVVMAYPIIEDLIVTPTSITGLDAYDGYKLRVTYAYGTISQQLDSYIDAQITALINGAPASADTFNELYNMIIQQGSDAGTIADFEGVLA